MRKNIEIDMLKQKCSEQTIKLRCLRKELSHCETDREKLKTVVDTLSNEQNISPETAYLLKVKFNVIYIYFRIKMKVSLHIVHFFLLFD